MVSVDRATGEGILAISQRASMDDGPGGDDLSHRGHRTRPRVRVMSPSMNAAADTLDIVTTPARVLSDDWYTSIDLRTVRFLLPGGLVAVACAAQAAATAGHVIRVQAPVADDVRKYASRMGLGDVLSFCGVQIDLPPVHHHERADVLVECGWAGHDTIGELADLIGSRLWEAGVDAVSTDVITTSVYEIADNVVTHAGSDGGYVCAQTYERGSPNERVEIAIGDTGRGIRASLSERHEISSDEQALRLAIAESVSGINSRRGLGLHYVARDIPKAGGRVTLMSQGAYLQVHPGGPYATSCDPVTGTLVGIRVPVGRMSTGSAG